VGLEGRGSLLFPGADPAKRSGQLLGVGNAVTVGLGRGSLRFAGAAGLISGRSQSSAGASPQKAPATVHHHQ